MRWTPLLVVVLLGVLLTFDQGQVIAPCPDPDPVVSRNADGTYRRQPVVSGYLLLCYIAASRWQEEWTDSPERGGRFIRRIAPEAPRP